MIWGRMFALKVQIVVVTPLCIAVLGGAVWPFVVGALGQDAPLPMLSHDGLTESSGVCLSRDGQMLYTHNDSGDQPRLFVFRRDGNFLSEVLVRSAGAIDWEDMCALSLAGTDYLAIGDVGDNQQRRENVKIYLVRQPTLEQLNAAKSLVVSVDCELTVTYDSGPINCEALAFDPQRQSLWLLSKEPLRCRLFEVELTDLSGKQECVARYRQTLFVPLVTGADISRDAERLVMCSYAAGNMAIRDNQTGLWKLEAEGGVFRLPARRQGESICFSENGQRLLLTSEFAPTPLFDVPSPSFQIRSP